METRILIHTDQVLEAEDLSDMLRERVGLEICLSRTASEAQAQMQLFLFAWAFVSAPIVSQNHFEIYHSLQAQAARIVLIDGDADTANLIGAQVLLRPYSHNDLELILSSA